MARLDQFLAAWWRDQAGTTGFSLMWFALCVIFAGLAVDVSNSYRLKQLMTVTADAAAHAGAVAVIRGADEQAIRDAVLASIESNMPAADHGTMIADASVDIQLLNYEASTNTFFTNASSTNTIFVQLHRSRSLGNASSSIFLQIADAFDRDEFDYSSWNVSARGLATFNRTLVCESNNWIYARGVLEFTANNEFGERYCIHAQDNVQMSMKNEFGAGTVVSMPDLGKCAKCSNASNPGIEAAMWEQNLLLDDTDSHVTRLVADFRTGGNDSVAFFANRPLDNDLTALEPFGYNGSNLSRGSVVNLTRTQFESLARVPSGLTYDVSCSGSGADLNIRRPTSGEVIDDITLITDCGLAFVDSAVVESAVIISTYESASNTVSADSGTRIGTGLNTCDPSRHTHIYGMGGMHFPAKVTGSNVTFRIAGDIQIAAASASGSYENYGVSMYSDSNIHLTSGHTYNACTTEGMGLKNVVGGVRRLAPSPQYYAAAQVPVAY